MGRRLRASSPKQARRVKLLTRLNPAESAAVLRSLLERHPNLVREAEEIARATMTEVDIGVVAENVAHSVLCLDLDDLGARAGRKSWGYVEPTEAAWELLGEAVDPFLQEMKRHIELGFETAAIATCAGIVLGLYSCRDMSSERLLGWAEDFPEETAGHVVATLRRDSRAQHRRAWRLPEAIIDQVPEWAAMLGRQAKAASGSR